MRNSSGLETPPLNSEACWNLLGSEMIRACDRMNHHFRCLAGKARFFWFIRHLMVASVNNFPRLTITNGVADRTKDPQFAYFFVTYSA